MIATYLLLSLTPLTAAPATTSTITPQQPDWLGCWADETNELVLWFEPERCGRLRNGQPLFYRVEYGYDRATLESWARFTELSGEKQDGVLTLTLEGARHTLRPVDVPEALLLLPYELPEDLEVDEDTVAVVAEELAARVKEDQRVRVNSDLRHLMQEVDEDNTEFVRSIAHELGWIDAQRFGRQAADAAFLIVQHSPDLRLMCTALPRIEKDVKAKRLDGQSFALLFDRVQLRLGRKQRYGSQIGISESGRKIFMPCEEPERVDELRKELGMGPLAEYLAYFEEDGAKVLPLEELARPAEAGSTRAKAGN